MGQRLSFWPRKLANPRGLFALSAIYNSLVIHKSYTFNVLEETQGWYAAISIMLVN